MRVPKLTDEQVQASLGDLPGWSLEDGMLTRTFTFTDFPAAIQFVIGLAFRAEAANHHPDMDIRYNKVTVRLTTHDSGGITRNDVDLAGEANKLGV